MFVERRYQLKLKYPSDRTEFTDIDNGAKINGSQMSLVLITLLLFSSSRSSHGFSKSVEQLVVLSSH